MNTMNEQLKNLQRDILEKKRIESEIAFLEGRLTELNSRIFNLDYDRKKEQQDVDALKSRSISAFIYRILGTLEDRIDKEKQEAIAAQAKYASAVSEMEALQNELELRREKLRSVRNSEQIFESLMREKRLALKNSNTPVGSRILELESAEIALEHRKKELSEAIQAGYAAVRIADEVLSSLSSANDLSTWDMLGGGLISDILKHSSLDEAQSKVNRLQVQLNRFKTELSDVAMHIDMQVGVDGLLRFADYFFDGFFVDWAVKDRIHQSQHNIESVKRKIDSIIKNLEKARNDTDAQVASLRHEAESLIMNA